MTPEVHARVMHEIILPTVEEVKKVGWSASWPAPGVVGRAGAPKVISVQLSFRRSGDQADRTYLKSTSTLLEAGIDGKLDQVVAEWDRRASVS